MPAFNPYTREIAFVPDPASFAALFPDNWARRIDGAGTIRLTTVGAASREVRVRSNGEVSYILALTPFIMPLINQANAAGSSAPLLHRDR